MNTRRPLSRGRYRHRYYRPIGTGLLVVSQRSSNGSVLSRPLDLRTVLIGVALPAPRGAGGGTRTHTAVRPTDFNGAQRQCCPDPPSLEAERPLCLPFHHTGKYSAAKGEAAPFHSWYVFIRSQAYHQTLCPMER